MWNTGCIWLPLVVTPTCRPCSLPAQVLGKGQKFLGRAFHSIHRARVAYRCGLILRYTQSPIAYSTSRSCRSAYFFIRSWTAAKWAFKMDNAWQRLVSCYSKVEFDVWWSPWRIVRLVEVVVHCLEGCLLVFHPREPSSPLFGFVPQKIILGKSLHTCSQPQFGGGKSCCDEVVSPAFEKVQSKSGWQTPYSDLVQWSEGIRGASLLLFFVGSGEPTDWPLTILPLKLTDRLQFGWFRWVYP